MDRHLARAPHDAYDCPAVVCLNVGDGYAGPYSLAGYVFGEPRTQESARVELVRVEFTDGQQFLYDPSTPFKNAFSEALDRGMDNLDNLRMGDPPYRIGGGIFLKVVFRVRDMTKEMGDLQAFLLSALSEFFENNDLRVDRIDGKKLQAGVHEQEYTYLEIKNFVPFEDNLI
jgi:hypothetical protein